MGVVAKRSSMTFYSDPASHYSHRVRIVLAEKGVTVEIKDCDSNAIPAEVSEVNPYSTLPTLIDRELVLYHPNIMMEYLDERFPHPPLLPVYPVSRAECRLYVERIEKDWCKLVDIIEARGDAEAMANARKELLEGLVSIAPIFNEKPYFMAEEFSIVDCVLSPILWRLEHLGIELPEKQCKPLLAYMERVFARESFQESLSEVERDMRD
ncbi:glutathione S-transferase N-terminal domain-containing protein [Salinibius halmophilus]|uniref:glutathione S-transferase N-terminal domain-containing protein n=1 Tax=Salinibius halmophilus TaxID=1853216 RepID=UPI000E66E8FC|nr:glutathione S-transferase N-terminal domain-containing protein [Salinibius halmophilus]